MPEYKYNVFVTLEQAGTVPEVVTDWEINTNIKPAVIARLVAEALRTADHIIMLLNEE